MQKPSLQLQNSNRRRIIVIISITLVAILIGVYTIWSINTWSSYKTSYENWQREFRGSVDSAVALPTASGAERAKKLAALKSVSSLVSSAQSSLCATPAIITWQHAIGSLREREDACHQIVHRADALSKNIQRATEYLDDEQAVAATVTTALDESKKQMKESAWIDQAKTWHTAIENVEKINPVDSTFSPVKESALEKLRAIESAWKDVATASKAKDRVKYEAAQTKLTVAYEGLSSLVEVAGKQFKTIADTLQGAYEEAFGPKA